MGNAIRLGPTRDEIVGLLRDAEITWDEVRDETRPGLNLQYGHRDRMHEGGLVWRIPLAADPAFVAIISFQPGDPKQRAASGTVVRARIEDIRATGGGWDLKVINKHLILMMRGGAVWDLFGGMLPGMSDEQALEDLKKLAWLAQNNGVGDDEQLKQTLEDLKAIRLGTTSSAVNDIALRFGEIASDLSLGKVTVEDAREAIRAIIAEIDRLPR